MAVDTPGQMDEHTSVLAAGAGKAGSGSIMGRQSVGSIAAVGLLAASLSYLLFGCCSSRAGRRISSDQVCVLVIGAVQQQGKYLIGSHDSFYDVVRVAGGYRSVFHAQGYRWPADAHIIRNRGARLDDWRFDEPRWKEPTGVVLEDGDILYFSDTLVP